MEERGNPIEKSDKGHIKHNEDTEARIAHSLKEKIKTSGEREYLRELLKKKLKEHGWEDDMQDFCKAKLSNRALTDFKIEDFVQEISQDSRATVPDPVRSEIYGHIKRFLVLGGKGPTS